MESTRKSELLIVVAVLLTAAATLFSQLKLDKLQLNIEDSMQRVLNLAEIAGEIRYYDEVLTMSAQIAAHSGDPMGIWQQRHALTSSMLDSSIRKATMSSTTATIRKIDALNLRLLAVEDLAFAAIASSRRERALQILQDDYYRDLKAEYNEVQFELQNALSSTAMSNRAALRSSQEKARQFNYIVSAVLGLMWAFVLSRAANWRRQIVSNTNELTELAHYDSLTGLANRTLFNLKLKEASEQAERSGLSLALILVDVDKFKDINDAYGHMAGDELLKSIASTLKARSRTTDTVARLGGDEFAVIATNISSGDAIQSYASDILHEGQKNIHFDNYQFGTTQSIGIALYPDDASSVASLMKKADFALYQSKQAGFGLYRLFDHKLEQKVQAKRRMQEDIQESLLHDHFSLHYQPVIDINNNRLKGVEALLRWTHPERGFVSPAEFVPVAEESGLIIELGDWVLKQACKQQVLWRESGMGDIVIAVNLSSIQFQNAELVETIKQTVLDAGLSPGMLELEITESGIMDKGSTVVELLTELNEFGLKLAIDDFGTGYSSLAYLKHFPVHYLKIDRDFVIDLPHNKDDAAIAKTIISMGQTMKLQVVAEGVETEEQLEFLRSENCDFVQGYYISKPLPAADFAEWFRQTYPTNKVLSVVG